MACQSRREGKAMAGDASLPLCSHAGGMEMKFSAAATSFGPGSQLAATERCGHRLPGAPPMGASRLLSQGTEHRLGAAGKQAMPAPPLQLSQPAPVPGAGNQPCEPSTESNAPSAAAISPSLPTLSEVASAQQDMTPQRSLHARGAAPTGKAPGQGAEGGGGRC